MAARLERIVAKRGRWESLKYDVRNAVSRETANLRSRFPPRDVSELARRLGVLEIRIVPLATKGRLMSESDGFAIEVNEELLEFEKQFTVAHELAHVIVEQRRFGIKTPGTRDGLSPSYTSRGLVEKLCDVAACEILLPLDWLRKQAEGGPSLKTANRVAQVADCSLEFVLKRFVDEGLWRCNVLWWEHRHGELWAVKCIPESKTESLVWVDPVPVRGSLIGKCLGTRSWQEGRLCLRLSDEFMEYPDTECMPQGEDGAISLSRTDAGRSPAGESRNRIY